MNFKKIITQDAENIFLDPEEFGEPHEIDGEVFNIIIDGNEMLERENRYMVLDEGIHRQRLMFYVLASAFGQLPKIEALICIDNRNYRVVDATEEAGIYSITVEENR